MPEDGELELCIQGKYLEREEFFCKRTSVAGIDSLLAYGVLPNESPKWLDHLEAITSERPAVYNDSSAAVLLVPYADYVFALTWGLGSLMLDSGFIDSGFGLRFALRKANSSAIKALTYHTMDTQARTAQTTVPGGTDISAFGMEEIGEIVSRLVGRITATGLTAAKGGRDDYLTIQGSDSLKVPLAKKDSALLADIRFLHETVENDAPVAELEHFEHTRPIKLGSPLIKKLESTLIEALSSNDFNRLALSWPAEWEHDHGEAHSYALLVGGRSRFDDEVDDLDLFFMLEPLREAAPEEKIDALKKVRVIGLSSDGTPMSRGISANKWITFETDFEGQRYVFHQGRWFNIGGAYLDMLRRKMDQIFCNISPLELPPWPQEIKEKGKVGRATEGRYNLRVSEVDGSFLCLDKKLIRTEQHPRGIEACDLLGPGNELIHVKRLDDSVSASHLFSQAIVSAESFRRQPDAEIEFRDQIRRAGGDPNRIENEFRARKVVLAFGGRKADPRSLMTFSQVTLARCSQRLADLDSELEIIEIEDSSMVLPYVPKAAGKRNSRKRSIDDRG